MTQQSWCPLLVFHHYSKEARTSAGTVLKNVMNCEQMCPSKFSSEMFRFTRLCGRVICPNNKVKLCDSGHYHGRSNEKGVMNSYFKHGVTNLQVNIVSLTCFVALKVCIVCQQTKYISLVEFRVHRSYNSRIQLHWWQHLFSYVQADKIILETTGYKLQFFV